MEEIAATCRLPYRETVIKETSEAEEVYHLDFGARVGRDPGLDQRLSLVVVAGFAEKPLMLLTTLPVTRSRKSLLASRGKLFGTLAGRGNYSLHQTELPTGRHPFADLRAAPQYGGRGHGRGLLACVYLGKSIKLRILVQHIEQAAKRIYGIPEFRFYALVDGIKQLLFGRHSGIGEPRPDPNGPETLLLPVRL